jgi:hypothetical protein
LYGRDASIVLERDAEGGARVTVDMPFEDGR